MSRSSEQPSGDLHELTATAAATAIRDGSLTAQGYAAALLSRSREQAHLNAFITLQPDVVLEAAAKADQQRKAGEAMGPPGLRRFRTPSIRQALWPAVSRIAHCWMPS
jgi:hypothetical protein